MNFVHVEDFFHPDAGYQLNILAPLQVQQGHRVTIITAELDKIPSFLTSFFGKADIAAKDRIFTKETGVNIIRLPLYTFLSGRAIFKRGLFKTVKSLNPDCVFVHGEDTFTGICFLLMHRTFNFPLVFDCHMVEMASENRFRNQFRAFYRKFITPIIVKNNIPLIRVVDSDYVEKCLGIPLTSTTLLSFGTDTFYFSYDEERRKRFREHLGIGKDVFLVLYAGKLDKNKGGMFLAEFLNENFSVPNNRKLEFLIVGSPDGDYGNSVIRRIKESNNRIQILPTQKYRDLLDVYCAADLALFPKQCSMSFFEVQACSVPILFEENEINSQRAAHGNAFTFVPNDLSSFKIKLEEILLLEQEEFEGYRTASRKFIKANFDYVPIAQQFTDVMVNAINKVKVTNITDVK